MKVKFRNFYQKTSSKINLNKPKRTLHSVYVVNSVQTIAPEENCSRLGLGFGSGLGLELGLEAISLGAFVLEPL